MEEELFNAVNQLSESSGKTKLSEHHEKSKTLGAKSSSKFPGYEVIWPEHPYIPVQKSKSSSKVPFTSKITLTDSNPDSLSSNHSKTGLCYSPPLRRSANASLELAKSQSCGNLDWLEPDDPIPGFKEQSNTPTKRLVNEAVVELNTLLNQLTTRTLSEDIDFESKSREKSTEEIQKKKDENLLVGEEPHNKVVKSVKKSNEESQEKSEKSAVIACEDHNKNEKLKEPSIEPNDTVVHSVTLVTKSYNTGSSPKEEEIVFHFPPPPRVPPPKDDTPVESFSILKKGDSLIVKESDEKSAKKKRSSEATNLENSSNSSDNCPEETSASQKFPQPAPRKSKQNSGLRRSSSYSNIGVLQSKNKGYENVFLEKYQTLSRLEIKPESKEPSILDKVVPLQIPLFKNTQSSVICSNYANIGDTHFTGSIPVSGLPDLKPSLFIKSPELSKNKETISSTSNQISHSKSMIMANDNEDSVYGKIYKVSDKRMTEKLDLKNINSVQDVDIKKKHIHSKKTERAPLPPTMKPVQIINSEMASKVNLNNSAVSKKLPSRKLEKAPLPPHLIQKSSSTMNVPQKNLMGPQPMSFSPIEQGEEKPKLPAVHENVLNDTDNSQLGHKKINTGISDKFVNRGLSHSQSDVSVFLALKERRMQSANQERKLLNMKSLLMSKRTKNEPINVSSSDSDSSYERIFLTKDEPVKTFSKGAVKEQTEQLSIKSYRKEVPVAPPRSKRRSTTEVQYTKVKAKDASHISSTSHLVGNAEIKNSKRISCTSEDDPPAIPIKTRDAFEIPEK